MIKVENIEVYNIARAIYSARNPKNSWAKSDSDLKNDIIGENDLDLMRRLYRAGSEHRKYARQIFISMDITAPLYWWKEMDTYKVGTVSDSCSTMHKIDDKELTFDDFSVDHLEDFSWNRLDDLIGHLNICRAKYIKTGDKKYWWQMIQLLPSSYNQRRTITMNYENVFNIIHQRSHHKLDEWKEFVNILTNELPYVKEIMEVDA